MVNYDYKNSLVEVRNAPVITHKIFSQTGCFFHQSSCPFLPAVSDHVLYPFRSGKRAKYLEMHALRYELSRSL